MMFDSDFAFINEEFHADRLSPQQLDSLLAEGWRHFGTHFFRYNLGLHDFDIRYVIPLRIRLSSFSLSKSQRRTLSRNRDLQVNMGTARVTGESEHLFHLHKTRFTHGVPDSLYDFLSYEPASVPADGGRVSVYEHDALIAESYFDIGGSTVSGIYATFDPVQADRRLGIFTLLKEIEFALENGKEFYYLGYSYSGSSFYDYKKRFRGSEAYNWKGEWKLFVNFD